MGGLHMIRTGDTSGSIRVLIVGGSHDFQSVAKEWLEQNPAVESVRITASAALAIEAARVAEADLILIDVAPADMDGFEATRRIKALAAPPVVVLLVMFDYAAVRDEARSAGADACIDKSALTQKLAPVLDVAFGRSRSWLRPRDVDPGN